MVAETNSATNSAAGWGLSKGIAFIHENHYIFAPEVWRIGAAFLIGPRRSCSPYLEPSSRDQRLQKENDHETIRQIYVSRTWLWPRRRCLIFHSQQRGGSLGLRACYGCEHASSGPRDG